jgi:hypothetical protein
MQKTIAPLRDEDKGGKSVSYDSDAAFSEAFEGISVFRPRGLQETFHQSSRVEQLLTTEQCNREPALTSASLQMKNEFTSVAQYAVGQASIVR